MALPSTNWIAAAVDDARFLADNVSLPAPIEGIYHDFAAGEPVIGTDEIVMSKLLAGGTNDAVGVVGQTSQFARAAHVRLNFENVYGCILIDRLMLPGAAPVSSGSRG